MAFKRFFPVGWTILISNHWSEQAANSLFPSIIKVPGFSEQGFSVRAVSYILVMFNASAEFSVPSIKFKESDHAPGIGLNPRTKSCTFLAGWSQFNWQVSLKILGADFSCEASKARS